MPNYNYLPNNKSEFPHLANVDTYKFDNDFDYGRFDYEQMTLQICTVPWDMGEAHIGARTISGIGNVVYFSTKEKRNQWFANIPDTDCYRFSTKFKELHRDGFIDVPIPYDMCAKHNYLVVHYEKFANENSPVIFEGDDGLVDWFWFIREVEFLAPNTTRLHILDDAFQTWIYDVNVTGMILERGHAPMFATRADEFLTNPLDENTYLLTEDVNFGDATQVKHIDALTLNSSNMYACIATTANPQGLWGTKANGDWRVPCMSAYTNNGAPSVYVFAVAPSNLDTLLSNIDTLVPQFKQTIQGVFFASTELVTLGTSFTFAGITCYPLTSTRQTLDFVELEKNLFGYPSKYADIAKLYTSPYAHLEITDENGQTDVIKIEETEGQIQVSAAMSLAYPFVNIDAHLLGVGGNAGATVTYRNVDAHTFGVSGQWYDTLKSWAVPTFAVVQEPSVNNDYATYYDRAQRVVDYTTAQTNENANADTMVANTDIVIAANTASTARSNTSAQTDSTNTQNYNTGVAAADNILVASSATSTISANEQQGNISAAAGIANGVVGAVGNAVSGNPVGAVSSAVGGVIGAASTLASTAVANGLTAAQATYTQASNSAHATASNTKTSWDVNNQTGTNTDLTDIQNNMSSGTAANSAATQKANAARNAAASQSAIDNDVLQAGIGEPLQFGAFANGESATTKPIALFAHVVTQSKSAIASAGDEFLRYGYMLDMQWPFDGDWNVGKYFTYWKLRDFWVRNLNVPDMYMDKLRFFLFGGVTIWRKPEDIGNVTVYENFEV